MNLIAQVKLSIKFITNNETDIVIHLINNVNFFTFSYCSNKNYARNCVGLHELYSLINFPHPNIPHLHS